MQPDALDDDDGVDLNIMIGVKDGITERIINRWQWYGVDSDNDSVSGDNDASLSMVKLAAKKIFINEISPQKRTKLKFSKTSYKNMKHICLSLCETKANNISFLEVRLHVDLIPALLTQTDSS